MKKLVAAILTLMMLFSAVAFADVDFSDWVEVQLPDVGMHFYRPANLNVAEDPAAEGGENCAYFAVNDIMTVAIYCIGTNDQSLADISASLTEQGFTVAENGFESAGLTYAHLAMGVDGVENYGAVVFQGSDGYFYDFECEELADGGMYTFGAMLGTLSPM